MESVLEMKAARRLLAVRPSTGSPLHPAVKAWTAIPGQLAIARQGQLALKSRIRVWPNGAVTIQQFDEKTIWYMLLEIAPGRGCSAVIVNGLAWSDTEVTIDRQSAEPVAPPHGRNAALFGAAAAIGADASKLSRHHSNSPAIASVTTASRGTGGLTTSWARQLVGESFSNGITTADPSGYIGWSGTSSQTEGGSLHYQGYAIEAGGGFGSILGYLVNPGTPTGPAHPSQTQQIYPNIWFGRTVTDVFNPVTGQLEQTITVTIVDDANTGVVTLTETTEDFTQTIVGPGGVVVPASSTTTSVTTISSSPGNYTTVSNTTTTVGAGGPLPTVRNP